MYHYIYYRIVLTIIIMTMIILVLVYYVYYQYNMDSIDTGRIFITITSIIITYFKYVVTTINTDITINFFLNHDYIRYKATNAWQGYTRLHIYIAGGMEDSILDYFTDHYILFCIKLLLVLNLSITKVC